ncbi:MAG: hypothetical protein Q4Q25_00060 [Methanocorpusculum sp.]|nr:hypothetical protein [Methanocorpusculum sp.]
MNEKQNLKALAEKDLSKVIGGISAPAAGQADKFRVCLHNCTEEKGKYPDCAGCLRNK